MLKLLKDFIAQILENFSTSIIEEYKREGRRDELIQSIQFISKWLVRYDSAASQHRLGTLYKKLDQIEEAIVAFHRAIELNSKADYYQDLGYTYLEQGRYAEAAATFEKAISFYPEQAEFYHSLGSAYYQQGHYNEAIFAYQQATFLNPKFSGFHLVLGNAYSELGRHEESINAYQQAIIIHQQTFDLIPNNAAYYNNLGVAYDKLSCFDQAITAYQQAIVLDPEIVGVYYNLGTSLPDTELGLVKLTERTNALVEGYSVQITP